MKFVGVISFILLFSFSLAQDLTSNDTIGDGEAPPPPPSNDEDSGPGEDPPSGGGGSGGCEDQAPWCSEITPSQCYNAKDVCCVSCKEHETGYAACPFGDKNEDCKKMISKNEGYCDGPGVKEFCCGSC